MAFLGAVVYVLLEAKKWRDLMRFKSVRHIIIGIVVGYVYSILYTEYNYPNLIMCFVCGFFGTSFIESVVRRFRPA